MRVQRNIVSVFASVYKMSKRTIKRHMCVYMRVYRQGRTTPACMHTPSDTRRSSSMHSMRTPVLSQVCAVGDKINGDKDVGDLLKVCACERERSCV